MNWYYFLRLIIVISLSINICFAIPQDEHRESTLTKQSSSSSLVQAPSYPVRKQILDALRLEVKKIHGVETLFVVKYIKVKDNWAWVDTLPQSADGQSHYEDISALLHSENGIWKVVEIPCTEVENPECLDDPNYFRKLKKRFPKLPKQILP